MSDISDLKFDDKNFNQHTAKGLGLLEKSLQQFGAGRSILIDKNNRIIGGNGVVEAAGNIGLEDLQIVESDGKKIIAVKRTDIDLDSKEGRELAMADNAVAAEDLSWDKGNIDEVSEQFGIDPGDWIGDWDSQAEQEVEEDEAPEVDESEPAKSELGKVYKLGNHRLMCGDSTSLDDIQRLMGGQTADLWMTDPPYNVAYGQYGSATEARSLHRRTDSKMIMNDKMEDDQFRKFLVDAYTTADAVMKSGAAFYIFHADNESYNFRGACRDMGWVVRECLIWNKNALCLGRQDYQWKHEPCLYGWKDGTHQWYSDRKQTTVIDFDRPTNSEEHPTMKPVGLFAYLIKNSTKGGDVVLDSFGGSGTTIVACEQLGRCGYLMELDPKYCDVIRKRYWKLTHDGNEEGWEEGTPAI